MDQPRCQICERPVSEWFLRIVVEDRGGCHEQALICPNCGVRLRLSSQKLRALEIDPWVHEAVARVLRGKDSGKG